MFGFGAPAALPGRPLSWFCFPQNFQGEKVFVVNKNFKTQKNLIISRTKIGPLAVDLFFEAKSNFQFLQNCSTMEHYLKSFNNYYRYKKVLSNLFYKCEQCSGNTELEEGEVVTPSQFLFYYRRQYA